MAQIVFDFTKTTISSNVISLFENRIIDENEKEWFAKVVKEAKENLLMMRYTYGIKLHVKSEIANPFLVQRKLSKNLWHRCLSKIIFMLLYPYLLT